MNATGKRRLIRLAEFLKSVPRKRFDLASWADESRPRACGFAGCAVGWATQLPSFKRAGFRLDDGVPRLPNGEERWEAVSMFFDLDGGEDGEAGELFSMYSYDGHSATPKQVARRIHRFIARKDGKAPAPQASAERDSA